MAVGNRYVSLWSQISPLGDRIEVIERGTLRQLRVNTVWQGEVDRASPRLLPTPYMQHMLLALCFTQTLRRFLVIGLGAGCLPRALHAVLPKAQVDVVEIDPDVVHVAGQFFDFPPAPADGLDARGGVRMYVQDGFDFIAQPPAQYDAIFVDAFAGAEPPAALRSRQTMWQLRKALAPGGVLAINLSRLDPCTMNDVQANMDRILHCKPTLFDPKNEERHDDLNLILMSPISHDSRRLRERRLFIDACHDLLGMNVRQLLANRVPMNSLHKFVTSFP